MNDKRIAWAITGAGHMLEECVDVLLKQKDADVFLSRAAEEVLQMYNLYIRIDVPGAKIYRENKASAPVVGKFSSGFYSLLVVAPATSNSVAKFVCGVSDTLVTNLFAQAGKARVPIVVYPTDLVSEVDSSGPHRERVKVYPRPIDLENTRKLQDFAGVDVVSNLKELLRCLAIFL
jgi:dihydromethanopterin reductase (acceptor)